MEHVLGQKKIIWVEDALLWNNTGLVIINAACWCHIAALSHDNGINQGVSKSLRDIFSLTDPRSLEGLSCDEVMRSLKGYEVMRSLPLSSSHLVNLSGIRPNKQDEQTPQEECVCFFPPQPLFSNLI